MSASARTLCVHVCAASNRSIIMYMYDIYKVVLNANESFQWIDSWLVGWLLQRNRKGMTEREGEEEPKIDREKE